MPAPLSSDSPFDLPAATYDATFTDSRVARWLREQVWQVLAAHVGAGQHLLELGCGTGEDALWMAGRGVRVLATDHSLGMLQMARRKIKRAGLEDRVAFEQLDIRNPAGTARLAAATRFDAVFSNFGALNCLPDLRSLADWLAARVPGGGRLFLVLMGPFCPWEIFWHLLHGQVRTAFRRWRPGEYAHAGSGSMVQVWYPSIRRVQAWFAPHFRLLGSTGIGVLLPPPYLGHLVERWPGAFERMRRLEGRICDRFPFNLLGDHYLMILEKS